MRKRYVLRNTNWIEFRKTLRRLRDARAIELTSPDVDTCANALMSILETACDSHMNQAKVGRLRPPLWWSHDLDRGLANLRRWKVRARTERNPFKKRAIRRRYQILKRKHNRNCFKARRKSWRDFVTDSGNNEPWGPVFRWLKSGGKRPSETIPASIRKIDGSYTSTLRETGERLLEQLVPADSCTNESAEQMATRRESGVLVGRFALPDPGINVSADPIARCDTVEVRAAIWRMKTSKAAGLDEIKAGILRHAWPVLNEQIVHVFNTSLSTRVFPGIWKNAALVVIRKAPEKDPSKAKSYRPISLLSVIAKALEHIIVARIRKDTDPHMSTRQYGFTRNRSTVDAISHALEWSNQRQEKYVLGVFLDITGAFDRLWWAQLIQDLKSAKCGDGLIELTKSYLSDRRAHMNLGDQNLTKTLTMGVPQGSEFGPDLWRYAVNPLLVEELPVGTELIEYADDLALLVSGKHRPELTARAKALLDRASNWADKRKLTFSAAKSQAIWLKGTLSKPIDLRLGGAKIKMTPEVKYLGLTIDIDRKFSSHLVEKARNSYALFNRLIGVAKSSWGLKGSITMTLYKSVFIPRICYAASVWAEECMRHYHHRTRANMAQRRPLLTITKAYKTTSTEALQVLAGVPPLDLELIRLAKVERDQDAVRRGDLTATEAAVRAEQHNRVTTHRWNTRWVLSKKGRCTMSWFPTVHDRLRRRWFIPDHFTSQFMSGHGCFNSSLHRYNLCDTTRCGCGFPEETAEHVLRDCPIFDQERKDLILAVQAAGARWPCENEFMTSSEAMFLSWALFCKSL